MVVTLAWKDSSNVVLSDPVDHGNIANGASSGSLRIRLSHNGTNPITGCKFYIQAYSGEGYTGGATPAADYTEIIAWGESSTNHATDGGFWLNQNVSTPAWVVHKSTQGVLGAEIALSADAGGGGAGIINNGVTAQIDVKINVPTAENVAGARFFDQCLAYTYTS